VLAAAESDGRRDALGGGDAVGAASADAMADRESMADVLGSREGDTLCVVAALTTAVSLAVDERDLSPEELGGEEADCTELAEMTAERERTAVVLGAREDETL
jgi:hypothetical protein